MPSVGLAKEGISRGSGSLPIPASAVAKAMADRTAGRPLFFPDWKEKCRAEAFMAKADITPRRVALLAGKCLCDRSRLQTAAIDPLRIKFGIVFGNSV